MVGKFRKFSGYFNNIDLFTMLLFTSSIMHADDSSAEQEIQCDTPVVINF